MEKRSYEMREKVNCKRCSVSKNVHLQNIMSLIRWTIISRFFAFLLVLPLIVHASFIQKNIERSREREERERERERE